MEEQKATEEPTAMEEQKMTEEQDGSQNQLGNDDGGVNDQPPPPPPRPPSPTLSSSVSPQPQQQQQQQHATATTTATTSNTNTGTKAGCAPTVFYDDNDDDEVNDNDDEDMAGYDDEDEEKAEESNNNDKNSNKNNNTTDRQIILHKDRGDKNVNDRDFDGSEQNSTSIGNGNVDENNQTVARSKNYGEQPSNATRGSTMSGKKRRRSRERRRQSQNEDYYDDDSDEDDDDDEEDDSDDDDDADNEIQAQNNAKKAKYYFKLMDVLNTSERTRLVMAFNGCSWLTSPFLPFSGSVVNEDPRLNKRQKKKRKKTKIRRDKNCNRSTSMPNNHDPQQQQHAVITGSVASTERNGYDARRNSSSSNYDRQQNHYNSYDYRNYNNNYENDDNESVSMVMEPDDDDDTSNGNGKPQQQYHYQRRPNGVQKHFSTESQQQQTQVSVKNEAVATKMTKGHLAIIKKVIKHTIWPKQKFVHGSENFGPDCNIAKVIMKAMRVQNCDEWWIYNRATVSSLFNQYRNNIVGMVKVKIKADMEADLSRKDDMKVVPNKDDIITMMRKNKRAYCWFCQVVLPAIVGTQIFKECSASSYISKFVPISSEAFGLLLVENYYDSLQYQIKKQQQQQQQGSTSNSATAASTATPTTAATPTDSPSTAATTTTTTTTPATPASTSGRTKGEKKEIRNLGLEPYTPIRGWSNEGFKKFNEYFHLVEKSRKEESEYDEWFQMVCKKKLYNADETNGTAVTTAAAGGTATTTTEGGRSSSSSSTGKWVEPTGRVSVVTEW